MRELVQLIIEQSDRIEVGRTNSEVVVRVNGESVLFVHKSKAVELGNALRTARKEKTTAGTVA